MFGRNKNNDLEVQRSIEHYNLTLELSALQQAGEEEEKVRSKIDQMLEHSPTDFGARLFAMNLYLRMGDNVAAVSQCAIGLALEPNCYALHSYLAILLLKQGRRADAERVLEAGWQHCQKQLPKRLHAEERVKYFSIVEKYQPR